MHDRTRVINLFTHIKGARTGHIIRLRAHHAKKRHGLPDLVDEALKPHSAMHTIRFIELEYVEKDDDAPHYTWGDILTATRMPKISIFTWVDSFTLMSLCYEETIERISTGRQTKFNKVIAKQITDDEKQTIATLHPLLTAVKIQEGDYVVTELIKLLAQNVTSFTKKYSPSEHPRILKYLRTRALRQVVTPSFLTAQAKGKGGGPPKRQKVHKQVQRAWTFLQEPATGLTPPAPYQSKVNNYASKGKGIKQSNDKGKGKSPPKGKGKGKPKGKGKRSFKGKLGDNKEHIHQDYCLNRARSTMVT
jgi:hypothetical protein